MSWIDDVRYELKGVGLRRFPRLRRIYLVWMALALTMGWFVSRAILIALFFLVVTPVGLIARIAGVRFLETERGPASYWKKRAPARPNYEKMS
jgi:hypothetical protein